MCLWLKWTGSESNASNWASLEALPAPTTTKPQPTGKPCIFSMNEDTLLARWGGGVRLFLRLRLRFGLFLRQGLRLRRFLRLRLRLGLFLSLVTHPPCFENMDRGTQWRDRADSGEWPTHPFCQIAAVSALRKLDLPELESHEESWFSAWGKPNQVSSHHIFYM